MNTAGGGLERRKDARLHRFGLGLGVLVAVVVHLAVLWGPRVSYRPVLEQARVRRVLVAQPYRPAPPPEPPAEVPGPAAKTATAPEPAAKPAPEPEAAPPPAPAAEAGAAARDAVVERPRTDRSVPAAAQAEPAPRAEAAPAPDEWSAVMAQIEQRRQALEVARAEAASPAAAGGSAGSGEGREGFLDPRIRVTVVSYPPTDIETGHPPIPYPDLRFHRNQLEAGICRVWYRVWTDATGTVVRSQLKAPAGEADRARYAPFIEAVRTSVATWPFERRKAEIHIDALFEIE